MHSPLFYCSQFYPSPSSSLGDSLSTPVTERLVLSWAFGWERFPNQTMYFRPDMGATRHDLDPTIAWHSKGKRIESGSSPVLPLLALGRTLNLLDSGLLICEQEQYLRGCSASALKSQGLKPREKYKQLLRE